MVSEDLAGAISLKFPKLLSTNQVTTLGSRLAAWSALSLFALLGAFLLLLPALSREVTILMALFVVVGSGVVIRHGRPDGQQAGCVAKGKPASHQ
ncbi:MAG: hypothetical protein ACYS5W_09475 [Planctomycetota bacterium]|jgi:hypothetical protein